MKLDDALTGLYDLDRWELRRLAAEALLISDGPDSPENIRNQDPGNAIEVIRKDLSNGNFLFVVDIDI